MNSIQAATASIPGVEYMRQIHEHDLIALGRRGDRSAIGELFERHYKTSLNVARRILSSEAESQDAVQSAYCAAFQHLDKFRGDASFKTWITRIVVNSCLMAMRAPWRKFTQSFPMALDPRPEYEFTSPSPSPETFAWCREIAAAHDRALSGLPAPLQAAWGLYALSDMSIIEVATALNLTIAAAKSRIFRARSAMRRSLQDVRHGEAGERLIQ